MTVRFKLIMMAIAVILTANSILSLVGVHYLGHIWLAEIQDRTRAHLGSADAAYANQVERVRDFLQATSLDHFLTQAVSREQDQAMRQSLDRMYAAGHLDFLTLLDAAGQVRYRPANPDLQGDRLMHLSLVRQALEQKTTTAGTILLTADQLAAEGPKLSAQASFRLLPTPAAKPTRDQLRTEGMVMAAVVPIQDDSRQVIGMLFGGRLLSRRNDIVDQITSEVFAAQYPEPTTIGTVTIFQQDLRIATNVLDSGGQRALGTRLSRPVFDAVLVRGETWSAPAFVVNDWYITAYRPIRDPAQRIIGALYVGFKRAPYVHRRNMIMITFLGGVLVATLVILALLLLVTNWVLHPIGKILDMCHRVIEGDLAARVGIRPPGEFGDLCQTVDDMAHALQEREQKLEHATKQHIGRSEKLASIGRLAAGLAHEINNPLTGVLTFAHLVRDRQPPGGQDREDLDLVIHETQRAAEVVQGLLEFARERPTTKRAIDVNAIIQRMVRLVENQKEMRKIHIEPIFGADLPEILGDANQLQQVVLNLFLNAAAAMPQGGILTIATRADETHVMISVADNGCGIKPEHLDKVFDPFFTTKPVGQGTGLGLSVSYGIVEQHGGSIELESEVDMGSTFTIRLPLAVSEQHEMLTGSKTP
ncbi:MAG: sensor histidine kinase [Pirellulaceae bacterium]